MEEWRVSGFDEVRELGRGAQGRVVLARHTHTGDPVAIKYVYSLDEPARDRLRHEAQMLAQIQSPHVARLFRLVESEQGSAIVMEAVDGVSLKAVLEEHGALGPQAALVVLKGSLLGLASAHAVGVVHRDYKPANVVVPADGSSKLIDFGVAALHGDRARSGTPSYMAPEQWRAEPATAATDVYAATCVFFECLTGHRPYRADDQVALMGQHVTAPVPLEEVPEPLRPLVARGMAKQAEQRPLGAAAFVTELEQIAQAAYGSGWEERGIRALAGATVALAALFPLAAAGLAPVAPGVAAAVGSASAGAGTTGTGFLAVLGGKITLAVVSTAVVTASVTGAVVYAKSGEPTPTPSATRPVGFAMSTQSLSYPDINLVVDKAQYATISGYRDPATQRKINQALHRPIDDAIAEYRRQWQRAGANGEPLPTGRPDRLTVKARIGLRGPKLLSVGYVINTPAFAGGGFDIFPRSVTVDLTKGRVLTESDVFRRGILTKSGIKFLSRRVPTPPSKEQCEWHSLEWWYKYVGSSSVSVTLTPDHADFAIRGIELCMGVREVKVPYDKLADLMNPDVLKLVRS